MNAGTDDELEGELAPLLTLELPGGGRMMLALDETGFLMGVFDSSGALVESESSEGATWESILDLAVRFTDPLEAEFAVSPPDWSDEIGGFDTGSGIELLFKVGAGDWVARLQDYEGNAVVDEDGAELSWTFDSLRDYLLDLAEGAADYGLGVEFGTARRIASPEQLSSPGEQAWLIVGDEASWPTPDELAAQRSESEAERLGELWTAAKQTEPGDLLLVYFMAPRKAACFVARAQSEAFYSADIGVNSVGSPSDHQWWVHHTPLIPIDPISFSELRDAVGGHLVLRGRSGKFLRPEVIDGLTFKALDPVDQTALDRDTQRPTGRADLPDPDQMSVAEIAGVAPGALRLESDVSTYLVQPTLRHVLAGSGLTVQAEFPIGRKRADFVVLDGDEPKCVIEVKLRAIAPNDPSSPDVAQAVGYATALGCAAILVDVSEFHLIDGGQDHVAFSGERQHLAGVLDRLREHILGA